LKVEPKQKLDTNELYLLQKSRNKVLNSESKTEEQKQISNLPLQKILEICKEDISFLKYKKYKTIGEKEKCVSRILIYYKEHEGFRKYCKDLWISSYFINYSPQVIYFNKINMEVSF